MNGVPGRGPAVGTSWSPRVQEHAEHPQVTACQAARVGKTHPPPSLQTAWASAGKPARPPLAPLSPARLLLVPDVQGHRQLARPKCRGEYPEHEDCRGKGQGWQPLGGHSWGKAWEGECGKHSLRLLDGMGTRTMAPRRHGTRKPPVLLPQACSPHRRVLSALRRGTAPGPQSPRPSSARWPVPWPPRCWRPVWLALCGPSPPHASSVPPRRLPRKQTSARRGVAACFGFVAGH